MQKIMTAITMAVLCAAFTGCRKASAEAVKPLMGIDWFTSYDDVKESMNGYTLLEEREKTEEKVPQKMQDYTGAELFDFDCDLTLCFTDSGLIGFNYHDIGRNQDYRDWYSTLEKTYGLPTEEGSGMASWYDNPAGKDTAIYLFNLEEGVQISIYATADSPDKSYDRTVDVYVPAPEIRTPVVPVNLQSGSPGESNEADMTTVSEISETTAAESSTADSTAIAETPVYADEEIAVSSVASDTAGDAETERAGTASAVQQTEAVTTTVTTATVTANNDKASETTTEEQEVIIDHTDDFLLNGLQFYGSPDAERGKMNAYTQLYEYRTEEPGQPWELIMEYENIPYMGKNCDGVLCFTSLGLVGINYFDSNTADYNFWVQTLTDIYGTADEIQYDYTAWNSSPVGSGTMLYVFALEDGVQISFFADDTGSELA